MGYGVHSPALPQGHHARLGRCHRGDAHPPSRPGCTPSDSDSDLRAQPLPLPPEDCGLINCCPLGYSHLSKLVSECCPQPVFLRNLFPFHFIFIFHFFFIFIYFQKSPPSKRSKDICLFHFQPRYPSRESTFPDAILAERWDTLPFPFLEYANDEFPSLLQRFQEFKENQRSM